MDFLWDQQIAEFAVGNSMGCGSRPQERDGQSVSGDSKQSHGCQKFSSYWQFPGMRISVVTCKAS